MAAMMVTTKIPDPVATAWNSRSPRRTTFFFPPGCSGGVGGSDDTGSSGLPTRVLPASPGGVTAWPGGVTAWPGGVTASPDGADRHSEFVDSVTVVRDLSVSGFPGRTRVPWLPHGTSTH
ncbi:hypothetical protein GCM10027444_09340 [Actinopolyspora lacussalsi]